MIKTEILTDGDPLDAVLAGAEKLYKAVSTTMGPRGSNVIFRKHGKRVGVTHDGVTVAKMVKLNNEAEDVGADLLREAAMKLDATTGDGTTTVTVLAYNILKEAVEAIKAGESPMKLKLTLEALVPAITEQIEKHTDKDVTEKKLQDVASVASGSREIGEEVGSIVYEAGSDTPVMLGFSDNAKTYSEVIDGFKIDSGPASPYLLDGAGVRTEVTNPHVVVADAKLRDKEDVLPLLRLIASQPEGKRDFLLVCSDIAGDALSLMVVNRLKGFAQVAVARVPQHINSHSEYLSDVAIACGAQLLSRNTGNTIKEPKAEHLGKCDKVVVEPRQTTIVGGKSIPEDFDTRIADLRKFAKNATTSAERKFADDRIKTLEQKVVSIFVGGQSDSEAEEKHYRYEDALGACKAALRGGVVPGGGTLLFCIGAGLDNSILRNALRAPLFKVLDNAGVSADELIIDVGQGVDVTKPEDGTIDLVERGIIDPAESEIECVKTAIAIAGLLMTSGAMIIDVGEPDEVAIENSISQS